MLVIQRELRVTSENAHCISMEFNLQIGIAQERMHTKGSRWLNFINKTVER